MTNKQPPWPKLSTLKAGDKLIADDGFDCLQDGQLYVVDIDQRGNPFVACANGIHHLDGQLNDQNEIVGLWRAEDFACA
jgi:hypothetical protein